jgi:hypothetical protein
MSRHSNPICITNVLPCQVLPFWPGQTNPSEGRRFDLSLGVIQVGFRSLTDAVEVDKNRCLVRFTTGKLSLELRLETEVVRWSVSVSIVSEKNLLTRTLQYTDPELDNPPKVIMQLDLNITQPSGWQREFVRINGGKPGESNLTFCNSRLRIISAEILNTKLSFAFDSDHEDWSYDDYAIFVESISDVFPANQSSSLEYELAASILSDVS